MCNNFQDNDDLIKRQPHNLMNVLSAVDKVLDQYENGNVNWQNMNAGLVREIERMRHQHRNDLADKDRELTQKKAQLFRGKQRIKDALEHLDLENPTHEKAYNLLSYYADKSTDLW